MPTPTHNDIWCRSMLEGNQKHPNPRVGSVYEVIEQFI